jgi:UDPglucose 6-dehydrogenase
MRVTVVGTGYLGAVQAACLARCGHEVRGIDIDAARVDALRTGRAPFCEPGLDDLLADGLERGLLTFGTDPAAVADADVALLCVGTPQRAGSRAADLSHLHAALVAIAPHLRDGATVVGKSTVPVGTSSGLIALLDELTPPDVAVRLGWNPEFLREGFAVQDTLTPDRIVLGAADDATLQQMERLWAPVLATGMPVVRTDLATAELAKVSANVMLAARISVVNTLAEVCEAAGADIADLVSSLGHDPRIGPHVLSPGLGFGGGCLPKDLRAFAARAVELGVTAPVSLLDSVDAVNMHQRARTVDLVLSALGEPGARGTVAVLGGAFKAGSDDVRDSPALDVAATLAACGATVQLYDPQAGPGVARTRPELTVVDDAASACKGAAVVLVATEWPEFAGLDPAQLADVVERPVVVDARLVLDVERWRAAGWIVHALGRGPASGTTGSGGPTGPRGPAPA